MAREARRLKWAKWWVEGKTSIKKSDGVSTLLMDGPIRWLRQDGTLYKEGEYKNGSPLWLRLFHPDGTLAYEARYVRGRENGVVIYQRSAKKTDIAVGTQHGMPYVPASVWRVEETHRNGRRVSSRRFTKAQAMAANPPAVSGAPFAVAVNDAKSFAAALAALFPKKTSAKKNSKPKPVPKELAASAARLGVAAPAELASCVKALAEAGFPDLAWWKTNGLRGSLAVSAPKRGLFDLLHRARRSMPEPLLWTWMDAIPLGTDGAGCTIVYLVTPGLTKTDPRVYLVDPHEHELVPVGMGIWDFARRCVLEEAAARGLLTDKERKEGIASLRGKAYAIEGELADGLKRLQLPRLLTTLRDSWLEIGEPFVEETKLPRRPKLPKKLDATGFALASVMVTGSALRAHRSPLVRAAKV